MRIDLHYRSDKPPSQIHVYCRCRTEFRKHDIFCRFFPDTFPDPDSSADLFVVSHEFLGANADKLARPVIVEERADQSMPITRDALVLPNLLRCFKVSVVRRDWINLPARRVHAWLLSGERKENKQRLLATEAAKVHPGIHFGMFSRMGRWVERARHANGKRWEDRPIDVLFVGTTVYRNSDFILSRHRLHFCDVMRSIRGLKILCVENRCLPLADYFELSNQAKIIVSPWGLGELCYRDFEAMLDGCVLVKPRTDFIDTLGDILRDGETYCACRPDASDLEEIIRSVLRNEFDAEMLRRNRDMVLAWWQEKNIVEWWCDQIRV